MLSLWLSLVYSFNDCLLHNVYYLQDPVLGTISVGGNEKNTWILPLLALVSSWEKYVHE